MIEAAFTGRVGKAAAVTMVKDGTLPLLGFSVAVEDGEGTQWPRVALFGDAARELGTLDQGEKVYVEGRLRLDTWTDREGVDRPQLQVVATLVQPHGRIGRRRRGGNRGKPAGRQDRCTKRGEALFSSRQS